MKKGLIVTIVAVILAILTVGVGIYNAFKNSSFWNVSIAQVLTLVFTLSIAFWATQFKNDQRNAKTHAEGIIIKIQSLVSREVFYTFTSGGNEDDIKKSYRILQRKLANCLNVLEEYGKQLGFQEDVKYIEEQFSQYKVFVSEHLNDFEYLGKSETHLRKFLENIDSKCDLIVVKLYR